MRETGNGMRIWGVLCERAPEKYPVTPVQSVLKSYLQQEQEAPD
jgi:hypothetical protein